MSTEQSAKRVNPCASHGYRPDLDGRLPIVYNGKPAEEWYTLYCHETLRYSKLLDAARKVLNAIEMADMNEGVGDRVPSENLAFEELREEVTR